MSSPFSLFLFLVLWKGNRVLCLEVEALHHLLLIIVILHQRSRHRIQRAGLLQKFQMKIHIFFHHRVALHFLSSRWIQHPILVSQIIIIKNHGSRRLPKSRFTRNRKVISQFTGNKSSNSWFTKIPFTALSNRTGTSVDSLRGRRFKGEGKGIRARDHACAPKLPLPLTLTPALPSPSPFKDGAQIKQGTTNQWFQDHVTKKRRAQEWREDGPLAF